VFGLRLNQFVALVAVVLGVVVLAWMRRHPIAEPTVPAFGTIDGLHGEQRDELEDLSAVIDDAPSDELEDLSAVVSDEPDDEDEHTGR
jgi:hypothetical protein